MISRRIQIAAAGLSVFALCVNAWAAYSIPAEQIDEKKIYWGSASGFEKAGAVEMDALIKATPEYDEIKANKIERGTGKYWILLNQANERALKAILAVANDTEYDFIAAGDYLGGLDPAIPSDDITELVLDQLE